MKTWKMMSWLLAILLIASTFAVAQVPPAPTNLTVGPQPNAIGALLRWQGSSNVAGYRIYKAFDSAAVFIRIASVQILTFTDYMVGPGHVYRYYVTAFNQAGESGPSNTVVFTVPPPPPRVTGTITGAVTDDSTGLPIRGAQIEFRRTSGIQYPWAITDSLGLYSVVLDTGRYVISAGKHGYRMEWFDNSPNVTGATPVFVGAGSTVTANFGLSPFTPPPPPTPVRGTIAGTIVSDSTGVPIGAVRVRFYRTSGHSTFREARTDSLGMYQAQLDTGRYIVYASKFGFRPEYFDNSPTPNGATPVRVTANATSTANFGLANATPPPPRPLVNVSGTVTDSATGMPIANATVAIVRTPRGVNFIQGMNGTPGGMPTEIQFLSGFGRMHGVLWHGRTDPNGNYTGRVPAGETYIVFSGAAGYFPEWFDNKRSPLDADRLTLLRDTSGINFALNINPVVQNSIAGLVIDSLGTGVPSHVVLFQPTPNGPRAVLHVVTDSLGSYSFRYLRTGRYFLKALPVSGYAPAWYKAGAFGVQTWQNADTVVASGNVTGINIGVVPVTEGGVSFIAGRVTSTIGSAGGAIVYAVVVGSTRPAGFDFAESNGNFSIENLAPGSYRIVVDKEGFVQNGTATYDVGSSNNFQITTAAASIGPVAPTGVTPTETVPLRHQLSQNYPNPFNPTTNFEVRIANLALVSLRVYDLLGREVATLVNGYLPTGTYNFEWNAADLASGVYMYRLQAGSYSETRRLVLLK